MKMIKDYIEITEHESLDALIAQLSEIRDGLPQGTDAELRIRGDAVFGRHISIGFMRPLTPEELDVEGRYADAGAPDMREAA